MSPSHPCRAYKPSQAVVFSNLMTVLSAPSHHPHPPLLLTQLFIFPHTSLSHAPIPTICVSCQHHSMYPEQHRRQKISPLSPNRWLGCAKIHPLPYMHHQTQLPDLQWAPHPGARADCGACIPLPLSDTQPKEISQHQGICAGRQESTAAELSAVPALKGGFPHCQFRATLPCYHHPMPIRPTHSTFHATALVSPGHAEPLPSALQFQLLSMACNYNHYSLLCHGIPSSFWPQRFFFCSPRTLCTGSRDKTSKAQDDPWRTGPSAG